MTDINTSAVLLADTLFEITKRLTDAIYENAQLEYKVERVEMAEKTANELLTKRIAESTRLTELINDKNKNLDEKRLRIDFLEAELSALTISNKNHLKEIADQRAAILSLRAEIKKLKRKR